jgi:predicted dehydrogenase
MTETTPVIGIAIIGFGVMGRTHAAAYERARLAGAPCELRGICTLRPLTDGTAAPSDNLEALRLELPFDPASLRHYTSVDRLLEDPDIHAVSICTPTDTHVAFAQSVVRSGRHALIEKPVDLRPGPIRDLELIAKREDRVCMPALCMRFWPGWAWLRDRVSAGDFGPVRSAVFQRFGVRPSWGDGFYEDAARSGGALMDLHVHDVDFIRWCFGQPAAVFSNGDHDHVISLYQFTGGPRSVVAEGGWTRIAGFPFRMRYTVQFEHAIADFDITRDPVLQLTRDGSTSDVPLPDTGAYDATIRHFVDVLAGTAEPRVTLADAFAAAGILEAETASIGRGVRMPIRPPGG